MRALSRKYANRKSTLRNLATSLVLYERIKTTTAKAKEVKPIVERLISIAKKNDLVARRRLMAYLFDENAVKKMFEVIVPRFKKINSGFVKTYRLGARLGDGADMMIAEFVGGEKEIPPTVAKAMVDKKDENAKKETRASARKTTIKTPAKTSK